MKLKKSTLIGTVVIIVLLIVLAVKTTGSSKNDQFAQCISDSDAKMYGAYWCSHCLEQKASFGDSWQHINYIECAVKSGEGQRQICRQAQILSYPTWEFGDGSRLTGDLSFEELSEQTGCEI